MYKRYSEVIEDADNFNSRISVRLCILWILSFGGTVAGLLLIKNVDDLYSRPMNNNTPSRTGYIVSSGILVCVIKLFWLCIFDMKVIRNAGFNSLRQKICLIIGRFLGIGPMAIYLILFLLEVYNRVTKNAVGFNNLYIICMFVLCSIALILHVFHLIIHLGDNKF
jgi:hypothetical protein